MKAEVEDVGYGKAMESLPDIKHDYVDIRFEHSYSATPLQNLKDEPVDWTGTSLLRNCLNGKEEIKDICEDNAIESLSSIKLENIEIKSEEDYSGTCLQNLKDEPVDCTGTSLLTDCVKNICDDNATESLSNIKCEDIEIKSEEDYSDTPLQNWKNEPGDCTNRCQSNYVETTNNSAVKHERNRYDPRDKKSTLKHRVIFEKKLYKCNSCDYETYQRKSFTRHQYKHKNVPEELMYHCDSCDYKTNYKAYLTTHQSTKHKDITEEDMHKCDSCGFRTIYKANLMHHQLRKHKDISEEDMHKCDLCDFKTKYHNSLTKHQLKHKYIPEEDMHKCDSCDFKTKCKYYLTKHQLKHKDILEEDMHKCDSCGFKTKYKYYLTIHQLKHKDIPEEDMHKCDSCDFKTKYKYYLTKHQLKHKDISKADMHKCALCGYKTKYRTSLIRHQSRKDCLQELFYTTSD